MRKIVLLISVVVVLSACTSENRRSNSKGNDPVRGKTGHISKLIGPAGALSLPLGETVPVTIAIPDTALLDSIHVFLGGSLLESLYTFTGDDQTPLEGKKLYSFLVEPRREQTGKTGLRLRLFFRGGHMENLSQRLSFLSDIAPRSYTYRVVNEYPHDRDAYTQGLQYIDGELYEGTGEYGTSSLRQVQLESGEVIRSRPMDREFFGEGITVLGDRVYQLTYRSQLGFVYNRSDFELIQKIYYQNREGWGLSHNGEELIMSDGTNVLYFLDPEMFTVNRQIEVYHDKGSAESLNELEYINGKIWANRYYTDEIVIIDPKTGKVEGRINLKGILKTSLRKANTDVLNGIAWDSENDRLFVTGKRWPRLFEIEVIPFD